MYQDHYKQKLTIEQMQQKLLQWAKEKHIDNDRSDHVTTTELNLVFNPITDQDANR